MTHKFGLFHRRHGIQHIPLEDSVTRIGVDGEVPYPEGGEVLEEVGTLRGVYMVVLQPFLHDDTGCGDMGPFHGDTQPVVTAAPASGTDEHVVLVSIQELTVDLFYLISDIGVIGGGEVVIGLDIHYIHHIL